MLCYCPSPGSFQQRNRGVLVLKDAKWLHLLPPGFFSGECPLYTYTMLSGLSWLF